MSSIETRARELLAAEYRRLGERNNVPELIADAETIEDGEEWDFWMDAAHAAIEAALRLPAGEDSARLDALEALVDQQPDKALLLHHGIHIIKDGERRYPGLGLSNTRRTLRQAIDGSCMIETAAPRHEPGEG